MVAEILKDSFKAGFENVKLPSFYSKVLTTLAEDNRADQDQTTLII